MMVDRNISRDIYCKKMNLFMLRVCNSAVISTDQPEMFHCNNGENRLECEIAVLAKQVSHGRWFESGHTLFLPQFNVSFVRKDFSIIVFWLSLFLFYTFESDELLGGFDDFLGPCRAGKSNVEC